MVIHQSVRRAEPPSATETIRPLNIEDVNQLPLGWYHRHDHAEIRRLVRGFPGRSVWRPDTGEFALIGPWRHRTDIVQVAELSAQRSAAGLIEYAAAAAGHLGADLMVFMENDERRRPSFYRSIDFDHLEDVITMELAEPSADTELDEGRAFLPVVPDTPNYDEVRRIDDLAFPWLWRNGAIEFASYIRMPDVRVQIGLADGQPVSYFGVTLYDDWGHLDRIAVRPEAQGQGIGYQTLAAASRLMARSGASTIGLSTQGHNQQSRRLYERFGFVRRSMNDYRLYGRALTDATIPELLRRPPGVGTPFTGEDTST